MGFPFDKATWDLAEGAIFIGWGGAMPGWYTLVGVVACVVILAIGQKYEKDRYKNHK